MSYTPQEKRLCFRLEVNGRGIYADGAACIIPFDANRHPNPSCDALLVSNGFHRSMEAYYYGYTDCKQLLNWWYTEDAIKGMQRMRVRLTIYETDDYYVGNTQMTFRMSSARKLGECDPGLIPELAQGDINNVDALTEYISRLAPYVCAERPASGRQELGSGGSLSGRVVRSRPVFRDVPAGYVGDGMVDAVPRSDEFQKYRDSLGFTFTKSLFRQWKDLSDRAGHQRSDTGREGR